ncbi:MAG: DUF4349 domain-containing protein [Anaerolineae bacterium]|nr:DUF4349 domain-containing protein [Anaerolineae bacterium]
MLVIRMRYRTLVMVMGGIGVLLIVALAVFTLGGGDSTEDFSGTAGQPSSDSQQGSGYNPNGSFPQQASGESDPSGTDILTNGNPQTVQERVILRDARLTIITEDVPAKVDAIREMALEMGGWVVNQNTDTSTSSDDKTVASAIIEVRVPSDQLETALQQIQDGVVRVTNESITGQDVTEDYVDLTSRLTNLQAAESQLQALLDETQNVEEVLAVYNQLTNLRGEIEVIQGRIRFYDQSAAFSSITVYLRPKPEPVDDTSDDSDGWRPGDTFEDALAALGDTLQIFADALIYLAVFAILIVPGAWILRRLWRWLGRKLPDEPAAEKSATGDGSS